jgi:hypothetical protein
MNLSKCLAGVLSIFLLTGLASCDKENGGGESTTSTSTTSTTNGGNKSGITFPQAGTLKLDIKHVFGDEILGLAPVTYVTAANDTIRVSQLSYYVSNIILTTVNGTKVPVGDYYLEDLVPPQPNIISIPNVPAGNYTNISYLIGVDSLANSTGQHTGDLDPSYGMYWTWSTGYVFLRLKGRYSAVSNSSYSFDIGGDMNTMKMEHPLTSFTASGSTINISLKMDVEKIFNSPNMYDLKVDNNAIHSANDAGITELKANINTAFTVSSIQ